MKRLTALMALLLASCSPAEQAVVEIAAENAWAREAGPGKTVSAAYLTLTNTGSVDDVLIGVSSSTGPAEMHSTSMDEEIMRMRLLERLAVPARESVKLEPGGTHLMLTNLTAPLNAGDQIRLSLKFEKGGEQTVAAQVRATSGDNH